ncbi:MAG: hypothetical protein ABIQ47_10705 [Tepidiformaceae bacterium]
MNDKDNGTRERSAPVDAHSGRYQFRVEGHLSRRWESLFEGMTLTVESAGSTLIEGPVTDQAALHSILRQIGDLGLELVSVVRGPPT